MKKMLYVVAMIFATAMISNDALAQSGNNDNWYIAQAKVAASACTDDVNGPITGTVETVSACFFTGFVKNVYLYRKPTGPNADLIRPRLLAVVQFGCDNTIISVDCH